MAYWGNTYLNTSYVSVPAAGRAAGSRRKRDLNTSYVSVPVL